MSCKLFSLITCLVLVLNFGLVSGVAEAEESLSITYDIYAYDPLTGTTTQITYLEDSDEYNPSWSPNGKLVAHDVLAGDQHDIYITNVKTGVSTPLIGAEGGNDAVWSPNGKWIAFDGGLLGDQSLYILPSEGGVKTFVRGNAVSADWAPNGKRLVFHDTTDGSIRTAPVDGGKGDETIIAMSGANPVWSPDGNWIAYDDGGDIWKVQVNVKGTVFSEPIQITSDTFDDQQPTWSMDSLSIVYHSGNNQNYDLWMVSADGGKSTWLTGAFEFGDYDPAYAKNSSKIAYAGFSLDMGGAISGQVTDELTGSPIEGSFVFACEVDVYCDSTQTDRNGFYRISLPPATYRVGTYFETDYISEFYDDKIYWDEADDVYVIAGKETPDINFALLPAGTISGRVMSEYGDPLPGLWVDACEYDTESYCRSAETNDDGYYSILLPPGEYWVQIFPETNWVGQRYDADQDGEPDRVPVAASFDTPNINFTLMEGGTISGTVYEASSGETIAGVHVDACSTDDTFCNGTETDEFGEYTIIGLPPDKEYRVFVWGQPGWASEVYKETIWWDDATLVSPDATGIDFTLDPGGSISGVVTDVDGNPLANIGVDIMDGGYGACTDENGNYTIAGLPFGTYDIVAGRDFCGLHPYLEQVVSEVAIDADTPDIGGIDFALAVGGSISGTVTAVGGDLIEENIDISACFEDGSFCRWTSVQDDGTYTIVGLPDGEYRVNAYQYPEGYWIGKVYENTQDWDAYTPVLVTAGEETGNINFTLEYGGAITGVVEDGGGNSIEGIWVVAHDYSGDYFVSWGQTDASGMYRILGLPAGTYRVFINPQNGWTGQEFMSNPVTVSAGADTFDVNFTLALDSTISGTVTDVDGNHIPERIDVSACWVTAPDDCFWTTVQGDNTYTIIGLPSGEFYVHTYEVTEEGVPSIWSGYTYTDIISLGVNEDVADINFMLAKEE